MGRSSWFCQPWVSSLSCLFSLLNLVSCNCMYSSELFTGFTHQESLVCFDSVLWFYSEFYALYIGNFHFCPSPTLAPHMIPSRHQTIIYNFSSHWKILKVAEGNESKSITTGTFIPFSHWYFMLPPWILYESHTLCLKPKAVYGYHNFMLFLIFRNSHKTVYLHYLYYLCLCKSWET